jgi:hypothetical protein
LLSSRFGLCFGSFTKQSTKYTAIKNFNLAKNPILLNRKHHTPRHLYNNFAFSV